MVFSSDIERGLNVEHGVSIRVGHIVIIVRHNVLRTIVASIIVHNVVGRAIVASAAIAVTNSITIRNVLTLPGNENGLRAFTYMFPNTPATRSSSQSCSDSTKSMRIVQFVDTSIMDVNSIVVGILVNVVHWDVHWLKGDLNTKRFPVPAAFQTIGLYVFVKFDKWQRAQLDVRILGARSYRRRPGGQPFDLLRCQHVASSVQEL